MGSQYYVCLEVLNRHHGLSVHNITSKWSYSHSELIALSFGAGKKVPSQFLD